MKKTLAVVVGVGMLAAAAWTTFGGRAGSVASDSESNRSTGKNALAANALPPSAVLKIDPRASSTHTSASTTIRTQALAKLSPLMQAYVERKNLPDVFRQAQALPDSGEAAFVKAEILAQCATLIDITNSSPRKSLEEQRIAFVALLPPNHPDNTMRVNAFDIVNQDRCGELKNTQTSKAEIAALHAKATQERDATALARELNCELTTAAYSSSNGARELTITPEQFARLQQSMQSKSPSAVRVGVGLLGNTYRNAAIALGGRVADGQALHYAANLLACQYGADCGHFPLRACASEGRCAASNYEDHLAFYDLSPNAAQRVEEYRAEFTRMIETGDFSALRLTPGEQPMDNMRLQSFFRCQ